ncbi:MAG: Holliday junction resolvase RuvX [Bacilli bacterium]
MKKHLLCLDLGKGSLGMALSRSGFLITPLTNVRFHMMKFEEAINAIKEVMMTEMVETFIIGYPSYPSGDPCEMSPIVEDFILLLNKNFPNIPVIKQDERYSTVEASSMLHTNGQNAKKQHKNIDSAAATVILERYLSSIGQI